MYRLLATTRPAIRNPAVLHRLLSTSVETMQESSIQSSKVLTLETMNPNVRKMEYAVRGAIPIRAEELRDQLKKEPGSLPFSKITPCNIGNPQQLNQKPLTFLRQVSALMEYTDLLAPENIDVTRKLFPEDAIERAKRNLSYVGNAAGAYT
ncbi:alanine transaminase, partial [Coemansia sp. RSA 1287]